MPAGRPTKMTETTLKKLEEAFSVGASDKEACFYAGISHETLYTYQNKTPGFLERKEALKENPVLLARRTVVEALKTDPAIAMKYLERKRRAEFAVRNELTGADGGKIEIERGMTIEEIDAVLARAEEERKQIAKDKKQTKKGQQG